MNEQRSTVRHHCPSGPRRQLFFLGSEAVMNANVTDVSTEGIAFVSEVPVEPGTHLLMEVLSLGHPRRHMELVRVVHSESVEEGKWLAGCSFVENFKGHTSEQWSSNAEPGATGWAAAVAESNNFDSEGTQNEVRWQVDGGQG